MSRRLSVLLCVACAGLNLLACGLAQAASCKPKKGEAYLLDIDSKGAGTAIVYHDRCKGAAARKFKASGGKRLMYFLNNATLDPNLTIRLSGFRCEKAPTAGTSQPCPLANGGASCEARRALISLSDFAIDVAPGFDKCDDGFWADLFGRDRYVFDMHVVGPHGATPIDPQLEIDRDDNGFAALLLDLGALGTLFVATVVLVQVLVLGLMFRHRWGRAGLSH